MIMEFLTQVASHPFFWGFALGMVFCGLALWGHFKTKLELKRYRRHLSDKLEIEAKHLSDLKRDKDKLKEENENLRVKTKGGADSTGQNLERELEIFARAEKSMYISAPGFSAAWENAKTAALGEVEEEEQGNSLPRKIFRKFFSSTGKASSSEHLLTTSDDSNNNADAKTVDTAQADS